jgi:dienelactone hydrolase
MPGTQSGAKETIAWVHMHRTWWTFFFGTGLLSLSVLCVLACLGLLVLSVGVNAYLAWGVSAAQAPVAQPTPVPAGAGLVEARATLAALASEVAAMSQPASTQSVPTPARAASFSLPASISYPLAEYTIQGLRARTYPGGAIHVRSVLTTTQVFTRYYIDYPSDGLSITGIMQIPRGDGRFPVVILNHGYIPRERYWSGADTWSAAEYLNRQGYLTLAPDFRSWGESDIGTSFFSTGQVIDTLNLISSLPSLPQADPERVGMWGHSMGGGVTAKAITIDPRIKAAVLYAPVSANDAQVLARWGSGCQPGPSGELAPGCAGAEVLTHDMDPKLYLAYKTVVSDPQFVYETSPIHYIDRVTAPVQIHIGNVDTTTPPEWSSDIYQTLLEAGKEVEYYTYPDQGHAFQGQSWRLFMQRVADFFDRNL